MLDKKAAELRRKYLQEWRKKNPEKVKKYNEAYWEKRLAREAEKENGNSE